MATSKLLKPTNVTISIPDFTDQPDQRVNSNCIDKEADAINSLNDQIGNIFKIQTITNFSTWGESLSGDYPVFGKYGSGVADKPDSYGGLCMFMRRSSDEAVILAITMSGSVYVKRYYGTWQSWQQI